MKIATIVGARPQFIKLAPVSLELEKLNDVSELIIHTGQHFDDNMSKIFFKEMKIAKPNYNLNINTMPYGTMVNKMVKMILPILQNENVDGVVVYGDTNSTVAGSLSSKALGVPIFHIEAGLRSHNRLMYEENNRIITDHLSTMLFCPTENAISNLNKENIFENVILSGDVMFDAFLRFSNKQSYKLVQQISNGTEYILSTIHRRENIVSKKNLSIIFKNLDKINDYKKIIMPIHPHTKKILNDFNIQSKITFIEPQGYISMLSLIINSDMVITDSGGLQKESFFAKKKCMTIRKETEWKELIDEKVNILCDPKNIFITYEKVKNDEFIFAKKIYGNGRSSEIIAQSIAGFLQNN